MGGGFRVEGWGETGSSTFPELNISKAMHSEGQRRRKGGEGKAECK